MKRNARGLKAAGFLALTLTIALPGCKTTGSRAADIATLRALHEDSLRAHREGDWRFFGKGIGDDLVLGSRGEIVIPDRGETLERFRDYLGRTDFSAYHDASEPIVHVSEDGTMGWVLAHIYIAGIQDKGEPSESKYDTTWTWVSIFEKRNGKWLRVANVSNSHDGPPE